MDEKIKKAVKDDERERNIQNARKHGFETAGSYDEFTNIISGANLKPVTDWKNIKNSKRCDSNDNITSNMALSSLNTVKNNNDKYLNLLSDCSIISSSHFRNKIQSIPQSEQINLIRKTDFNEIFNLFRHDFSSDDLDMFITIFLNMNDDGDIDIICNILNAFTKLSRFNLILQFISKNTKKKLVELFQKIEKIKNTNLTKIYLN